MDNSQGSSIFKMYDCPKCRKPIKSFIGDQAQYVVCPSCWSVFKNDFSVLSFNVKFKREVKSLISLGFKGVYKDKNFQLIGVCEVKESNAPYYWREYVLKYEDGTYGFLNEYDGHWSYVYQIYDGTKKKKDHDVTYKGEEYQFFSYYKTLTVAAQGEFYWNVAENFKPLIHEYINPPMGLLIEYRAHETNWFQTEYLPVKKIKEIFGPNIVLPKQIGNYPTKPYPFPVRKSVLVMLSLFYLALMTGIMTILGYVNDEKDVYSTKQFVKSTYPDSNVFISPPFDVNSLFNSTALDVEVNAGVFNNWLETSCKLVNESTGHEYYFENGVEYYFGVDGGDSWSEGSQTNVVTLSEVPNGIYRIVVKTYVPEYGGYANYYTIRLRQGVLLWSNFFLIGLLVLSIPTAIIIHENYFYSVKWSQSNVER